MLAIVGCGDHVIRNILPAIEKIKRINVGYIVVRDVKKYSSKYPNYNFVNDFSIVLADANVKRVYIATPISEHYSYSLSAINAGKHVLCEKALTDNFDKTKMLVDIAISNNINLQEVVMFEHHNQFSEITNILSQKCFGELKKIHAIFKIPHLDGNNIRYLKNKGGGALLDVGFYPIALITSLLGEPKALKSISCKSKGYEVDLSGCGIFDYDDYYAIGEWGIGRGYQNELIIEFENANVHVERCISKPANLETKIKISPRNNDDYFVFIQADDHFKNMLIHFLSIDVVDVKHCDDILLRAKIINGIQNETVS
jgi:NDP-hexose-3-ketoreductase